MQARSFALTKIQPPRGRPGLVARGRLERAMTAALAEARLVLISAPAGFGKTTVLTRQIAQLEATTALAWIAADEDDDLARLAACAVAALEPYDLPWRTSPEAVIGALDGATPARRKELAGDFINTLVATDVTRGLIVIDDAHRIQDPTVFAFLDHVVERLPSHWGIVIATRVDPPMALARLRARGELAEFRQEDLRFTRDEVQALVDGAAAIAPRADVQQLLARTQGWAAGLGLALNSRRGNGALTERHVYDYLAAEVLAGMPAALRRFLLRCSVLPELEPARCAAVSGDPQAGQWLAEIERRGLFVSLRGEGSDAVLCLHDLFRDCLDDLLRRDHPDELPELLRRAAAGEPDTLRRVSYLLRAGAWAEARQVVIDAGPTMLTGGAIGTLSRLLDQFPPAERESADVEFLRGLIGWARWDFDTMRRSMHGAAAGYETAGNAGGRQSAHAHEALALNACYLDDAAEALLQRLDREPLDGEALAMKLHARIWQALDRGPLEDVASLFARELDLVEQRPSIVNWYRSAPTTRFIGLPGLHRVLERYVDGARRSAEGSTTALTVLTTVMQAWLPLWAGAADLAEPLLRNAADDARWLDQARALNTPIQLCSAFMHALRGDAEAAIASVRAPREALADEPVGRRRHYMEAMFLFLELRFAAATGRHALVLDAARRLHALAEPNPGTTAAAERALVGTYVAEAEGRFDAALVGWRAAVDDERLLRILGVDLEVRVRFAAALLRASRPPAEAAAALRPVLARALESAEHLPALLTGPAVLGALAIGDWRGVLGDVERRVLADWLQRAQALRQARSAAPSSAGMSPSATADGTRVAPSGNGAAVLSEREREVLARLAAGDSNKLIARAFDLSPHTVKRHVANILDKLALSSRGQAAAWYHDHA
jgi:LuxR family maltose regulon positive regulatory protein